MREIKQRGNQHSSALFTCEENCGFCGYALNLSSSNRSVTQLGSKYRRSMKKGIFAFNWIDESRFSQVEEVVCLPYYLSSNSWGIVRRRTKLLCRKCGAVIGKADGPPPSYLQESPEKLCSNDPDDRRSSTRIYRIRIRALQPS